MGIPVPGKDGIYIETGAWRRKKVYCRPISPVSFRLPRLGLYSLGGRTYYHKILWRIEAVRFGFRLFAIALKAHRQHRCRYAGQISEWYDHNNTILPLRDFTRFGGKMYYRSVNKGRENVHSLIFYISFYHTLKPNQLLILFCLASCNGGDVHLVWPPWPESRVYVPTMRVGDGQCNLTMISFRLILSTHTCSLVVF